MFFCAQYQVFEAHWWLLEEWELWCVVPCPGCHSTLNYNTHLVTHRETNLMHCLDGHLGSTYSGRDGRSKREWVQGSTLGWFNGTGKYGDKGWGGVIGGIHCAGVIAVTPLDHEGCTSRGWGIDEATVGKELCGALLGSLTSAYH